MQSAPTPDVTVARPRDPGAVTTATVAAVVATVGVGLACWALTIPRMQGMNMGVATRLGTFPFFVSVWIPMMAAMMLPGVAPACLRLAHTGLRALQVPRFVAAYLAVWALVGALVYALYRPHGAVAAGVVTVAVGLYELTPTKRRWRQRCRATGPSGTGLGLCCVGSSIGLMLLMLALGAMSLVWMALVAAIVVGQKLVAPRRAVDVAVALAVVALGVIVLLAPDAIPHVVPAMGHQGPM